MVAAQSPRGVEKSPDAVSLRAQLDERRCSRRVGVHVRLARMARDAASRKGGSMHARTTRRHPLCIANMDAVGDACLDGWARARREHSACAYRRAGSRAPTQHACIHARLNKRGTARSRSSRVRSALLRKARGAIDSLQREREEERTQAAARVYMRPRRPYGAVDACAPRDEHVCSMLT